jgi:hypothetical protein
MFESILQLEGNSNHLVKHQKDKVSSGAWVAAHIPFPSTSLNERRRISEEDKRLGSLIFHGYGTTNER